MDRGGFDRKCSASPAPAKQTKLHSHYDIMCYYIVILTLSFAICSLCINYLCMETAMFGASILNSEMKNYFLTDR